MSGSEDEDDVGSGIRPTPEDWKHITKPTAHDVLCGRGGGTNNHPGNVKFRLTINEHKLRYLAASKVEKPKVAREVVDVWRSLDPPGRFLARKDDSKRGPGSVKAEGNVWYDVGDKKAREKASQCLRERTPDVLPYVREMQRQQDVIAGQGLRLVEQQMRMRNEGVASINDNGMNGQANMVNGQHSSMQTMIASMNGMDGYNSSMVSGGIPGTAHTMSEPDISNAFSVEHFFTHGFQNTPSSYCAPDDPLSLQQMSQDPNRWDQAGFQASLQTAMPPPVQVFSTAQVPALDPLSLSTNFGDAKPDNVGSSMLAGFHNSGAEDELTLEEYMESMKEFKAYHLDSDQKELPRTSNLLDMQSNSWVKSFHSIENNSKSEELSLNDSNGSFPDLPTSKLKNKKLDLRHDKSLSKQTSTRTHLSAATQKSAMSHLSTKSAQSTMSGISMFSEMSENTRGSKMSANRNQASSLSMMSDFTELTDLSETLTNLDLHAGTSTFS